MLLRLILLDGAMCVALALGLGGCSPAPVEVGEVLRPEHPRPEFERADWLNLNGRWALQLDPSDEGLDDEWFDPGEGFDGAIAVPVEAPRAPIAWYRREVTAPEAWAGRRVWLRLGESFGDRRVWIDGREAGEPGAAEIDVTELLPPGGTAALTVRAAGAGLSQTVWLEARPENYIRRFSISSHRAVEGWMLDVAIEPGGPGGELSAEVAIPDLAGAPPAPLTSAGGGRFEFEIPVAELAPWTPEDPQLHDLEATLYGPGGSEDRVRSYFGLRSVQRGRYSDADFESVMLNGEPLYLRGAVDRPGETAPTDEALRAEVEQAKNLGFNFLRMGAVDPRKLYWADRLGLTVMIELSGDDGRVALHRNHPSVIGWFGEVAEAKDLDPTRLAEDRPPHRATDLNSQTFAPTSWDAAQETIEQLVANTYVGSAANYATADGQDGSPLLLFGYGTEPAPGRDLSLEFRHWTNLIRRYKSIQGYAYSTSAVDDFGYGAFLRGMGAADLQGADFVGYVGPPILEVEPGRKLPLRTFVSHFSERTEAPLLQASLVAVNDLGGEISLRGNPRKVRWERYGVTEQPPLPMTFPEIRNYVGMITLELLDDAGQRLAANAVSVIVRGAAHAPRAETLGPRRLALRLSPPAVAEGRAEAVFTAPARAVAAKILEIEVLVEAAVSQPGKIRVELAGEDLGEVEAAVALAGAPGVLSHRRDPYDGGYGRLLRLSLKPTPELLERLEQDPSLRLVLDGGEAGLLLHGEQSGLYPLDPTLILTTADAMEPL